MFGDFRLKVFMTLSETGNFTRAADRLNISQPAVSQNIAALEKDLGVKLFERNRGEAVLTQAGKVFKEYASKILHWYDSAEAIFSKAESVEMTSRKITIAATPDIASSLIQILLQTSKVTFPNLVFDVRDFGCEYVKPSDIQIFTTVSSASEMVGRASETVGRAAEIVGRTMETEGRATGMVGRAAGMAGQTLGAEVRAPGIVGRDTETEGRDSDGIVLAEVPASIVVSPVSSHARAALLTLQGTDTPIAVCLPATPGSVSPASGPGFSDTRSDFSASGSDVSYTNPDFSDTRPGFSSTAPDISSSGPNFSDTRPGFSFLGRELAAIGPELSSNVILKTTSPEAVKKLVAAMPEVIGIVPLYAARKEIQDGSLLQVAVPTINIRYQVHFRPSPDFAQTRFCALLNRRLTEILK